MLRWSKRTVHLPAVRVVGRGALVVDRDNITGGLSDVWPKTECKLGASEARARNWKWR